MSMPEVFLPADRAMPAKHDRKPPGILGGEEQPDAACPTSVYIFEKNRSPDFSCILYIFMTVYLYMLPHFSTLVQFQ